MKDKSKKNLFVEMTPAQAAAVNGGAYWTQNRNRNGGGSGGGGSSSDSP